MNGGRARATHLKRAALYSDELNGSDDDILTILARKPIGALVAIGSREADRALNAILSLKAFGALCAPLAREALGALFARGPHEALIDALLAVFPREELGALFAISALETLGARITVHACKARIGALLTGHPRIAIIATFVAVHTGESAIAAFIAVYARESVACALVARVARKATQAVPTRCIGTSGAAGLLATTREGSALRDRFPIYAALPATLFREEFAGAERDIGRVFETAEAPVIFRFFGVVTRTTQTGSEHHIFPAVSLSDYPASAKAWLGRTHDCAWRS